MTDTSKFIGSTWTYAYNQTNAVGTTTNTIRAPPNGFHYVIDHISARFFGVNGVAETLTLQINGADFGGTIAILQPTAANDKIDREIHGPIVLRPKQTFSAITVFAAAASRATYVFIFHLERDCEGNF